MGENRGGWKFSRKIINLKAQITAGRMENILKLNKMPFYLRAKSMYYKSKSSRGTPKILDYQIEIYADLDMHYGCMYIFFKKRKTIVKIV